MLLLRILAIDPARLRRPTLTRSLPLVSPFGSRFAESISPLPPRLGCPSCQASRSREWLQRQCRSLLPVPYFHVVFTLPQPLHSLLLRNQAVLYKLLFDCVAASLLAFSRQRLGGTPGITAILHTWGEEAEGNREAGNGRAGNLTIILISIASSPPVP